jgi:hypothetical protein
MRGHGKAVLGVFLVFVLGALAGGLATSVYLNQRSTAFFQRGTAGYIDLLEKRMTRNLSLDPDQKQQIHAYFLENLEKRKELQAQIKPGVQEVNRQTFEEIRSALHPDQLRLFHQNLVDFRKRSGRALLPARAVDELVPSTNAPPQH